MAGEPRSRRLKRVWVISIVIVVVVALVVGGVGYELHLIPQLSPRSGPTTQQFKDATQWQDYIVNQSLPALGCYNATYPDLSWQPVACDASPPPMPELPAPPPTSAPGSVPLGSPDPSGLASTEVSEEPARLPGEIPAAGSPLAIGGAQSDFMAGVPGGELITESDGTLSPAVDVTSETTSAVPDLDNCHGQNEFSLQLNSNEFAPVATAFTDFNSNYANSWVQFVVGNDPGGCYANLLDGLNGPGITAVSVQYWLLDFADDNNGNCPNYSNIPQGLIDLSLPFVGTIAGPWISMGGSCMANGPLTLINSLTVSELADGQLYGRINGNLDEVTFCLTGISCSSSAAPDGVVDLSKSWTSSEFNVFGLMDSSEAMFNPGAGFTVTTTAYTTSDSPVTCLSQGTTGESVNMNFTPEAFGNPTGSLSNCSSNAFPPQITFVEANSPPLETETLTTGVDNPASGWGTFSPDCSNGCVYAQGSSITVTAVPSPGFEFSSWTTQDGVACSANPCTFAMPASNVVLHATFTLAPRDIPGPFVFTISGSETQTVAAGATAIFPILVTTTVGTPEAVTLYCPASISPCFEAPCFEGCSLSDTLTITPATGLGTGVEVVIAAAPCTGSLGFLIHGEALPPGNGYGADSPEIILDVSPAGSCTL